MTKQTDTDLLWLLGLFSEVGIINQLSTAEFQRVLAPDLNVSEYGVLNHFMRLGDNKTPSYLARVFQMTKPSMTAIIAKLQSKGYVKITPGTEDRRQKFVHLTPAGRKAHGQAAANTAPLLSELLTLVDEKKLKALLPGLQHLREVLDNHRNERDGLV